MRFPRGLRALNHADYRVFFVGQSISLIGTWMQSVAQSWLVLQLTNSPFKLGLIGTLQFAPMLALSVFAGAVADRLPKRRLLIATQVTLGCQALVLAILVAAGHVQFWHVGLLALLMGFANTLDLPARQSFVVGLVAKEDVVNAIALNSAAFNAARIVGPAAAGLLIARSGMAPAFFLNALSFAFVVGALLRIRAEGRPEPQRGSTMLAQVREGLQYAIRTPTIRAALAALFVVSLFVFNFNTFMPLLARNVLHQGAEGFGFLMAALGFGAVAGALTLGMVGHRQPPLPAILAAGALACGGIAGLSAVRQFWTAVPILFVVGYAAIVTAASCNTTLQLTAADALRGRVMSLYTLVFGGTVPVGAFMVGTISEHWGVGAAFLGAGGAGLLGLALVWGWWAVSPLRSRPT